MLLFYGTALLLVSWCRLSLQVCTTSQFECPSTQTCIPVNWACDYYYDCSDNVDEDDPEICPFGSADMSTAAIYSVNGGSSHLVNLFGDPDRYGPMLGKPSLANSLPLRYTGQLGSTTNTFGPITVDYRTQIVYYGNNNQGLIQYGYLMYNNVTDLNYYQTLPVMKQISSLSIDWKTKNLYWIDGEYKFIAVLRADGTTRPSWKLLVSNLSSPKDIAVNPLIRCLFWSDGNGTDAKIERYNMSGNRIVLVNSAQGLVAPATLVVDFASQRLYWLDAAASTLGSVNFDGSNVMTWNRAAFSGFSTMTVRGNMIFFGDKTRSRVHVYNKTNVTTFGYKEFSRASGPITDMTMFAASSQPSSQISGDAVANEICYTCSVDNGNCSQLCFATSLCTIVCDCANGLVLSADGRSCQISETTSHPNASSKLIFLSDFNQWSIYQLQPDTGKILTVAIKSNPIALTVDTNLSIIYFIHKDATDNKYRIHRRSFDGEIDESIFTASTAISRLAGLALDNIRGLLYYTDSYLGVVGELSTNGAQNRIIFQVFEEFPRAIVVDTRNSRLYWTDCSSSPSVQTSRVDGTDRRTLISGTMGSCFTGLAVNFIKKVMYFTNSSAVETSSLDGSLRTTLYTRSGADFNSITIMDHSLIIADRNQRIPLKQHLTSTQSGSVPEPLPRTLAIFSNVSDIKFFDFNPGVPYYCKIDIVNMIFKSQLSNQSTTEYQTLFDRISTLLDKVYMRTLSTVFVNIDDIYFRDGGNVIAFTDTHLTSTPSDEMNDVTMAAILDAATADSLLVHVNCSSSGPFVYETTMSPPPTSSSSSSTTPSLLSSSLSLSQPPGTPTIVFLFVFRITNLEFTPSLGDPTSSENKNLSAVLIPLLSAVFRDVFGSIFLSISNVCFTSGSVVVSSDIGLSSPPTDDMVSRATTQVGDQLAANGFNVTAINITALFMEEETTWSPSLSPSPVSPPLSSSPSPSPTSSPLLSSPSSSPTSSPSSSLPSTFPSLSSPSGVPGTSPTTPATAAISATDQPSTIWIIIGVVVGGGSFVIVVVIIIVCCVVVRLTARNKQDPSTPSVGLVDPKFEFDTCTLYQEIDDDQVADDVTPRDSPGYEHLRKQNKGGPSDDKYGDYIAALPYAPMPPPSVRSFADCEGYMRLNRFFVRPLNIEMDRFPSGSVSTLNRGAPDYLQVNPPARSQNDYTEKAGSVIDGEVLQPGRPQNFYTVKEGIGGVTVPGGGDGEYIRVTKSRNYERIGEGSPGGQPGRIVSANARDSIMPDPDDYLNVKESTCTC